MNKPQSITAGKRSAPPDCSALHREYEVSRAKYYMSLMPELQQAEKIARHYLAHATIAQQLLMIIEAVRGFEPNNDTEALIKYWADQIRNNHAHDFGIELSWPNASGEGRADPERNS